MADEPTYPDEIRIPFTMQVLLPPQQPTRLGRRASTWVPPVHKRPAPVPPFDHDLRRIAERYLRDNDAFVAEMGRTPTFREMAFGITITAEAVPAGIALAELATVIVEGVATVVAVLALPEVLAGIAAGLVVVIVLEGVRRAFADPAAARRWAEALVDKAREAEQLPIFDPLPPLPPMEAGPDLPPDTGHAQPTVRLPALPQPQSPVALPPVLAGPDVTPPEPTIVESSRGGYPASRSREARAAAASRDHDVTKNLDDADWWAHHLINLAATRRQDLVVAAAARAGWRPDAPHNVAALPNTPAARRRLGEAGISRPLHNSGHYDWNKDVKQSLKEIGRELDRRFGEGECAEKDRAALRALNALQRDLRRRMLDVDRLTMLEQGNGGGQA